MERLLAFLAHSILAKALLFSPTRMWAWARLISMKFTMRPKR